MTNLSQPGRRSFLRRSIAVVPAATVLGAAGAVTAQSVSSTPSSAPDGAASTVGSTGTYAPVYFHADEWAFVTAAVARLIPADESGPGAVEAGVPEFIDRQMESAWGHGGLWYMQGPFAPDASPLFGYQNPMPPRELYRAAIAALQSWCQRERGGKRFEKLDAAQQDEVLHGLEGGTIALENVDGKAFFGFLLQNTKEGFFSDPIHGGNKNMAGWRLIGFPGARADFIDWVGRFERYPLPPVGITGPQG